MNQPLASETLINAWLESLSASGHRATDKCRAIIEIILRSQKALDPLSIFDAARQQFPGIGLVTVYRTLQKLQEIGLVQHVHQADGCHRVLPAFQGHQHLLICKRCGQIVYFSGDNLHELTERVTQETGFSVEEHWLQLFGLCPNCQSPSAVNPG